jgi:hypothetical protein
MSASPFALLELPDGRWCVTGTATIAGALIAGSFAPLAPRIETAPADSPVGIFPTRDAAELAIQRATPSPRSQVAEWLRSLSSPLQGE